MHHSRQVHLGLVTSVAAAISLLSACVVPHNDTLLFGTDTKIALDVSMPPETAGTPQVTVGYKRREFVWMPLLANANSSKLVDYFGRSSSELITREGATIKAPIQNGITLRAGAFSSVPSGTVVQFDKNTFVTFTQGTTVRLSGSDDLTVDSSNEENLPPGSKVSVAEGSLTEGKGGSLIDLAAAKFVGTGPVKGGGTEMDTYSVIASIGASISGDAQGGGTGLVGIAQYIATGIAARRLAEKGGKNLVSVNAPSKEHLEVAEERAKNAEMRADDAQNTVINLTTKLTKESFSEASLARVTAVAQKVDDVSDSKAIEMVNNPPVKDAQVDEAVQEFDSNNSRSSDANVAKRMLKMRIFRGKRDENTLAVWEAALNWAR